MKYINVIIYVLLLAGCNTTDHGEDSVKDFLIKMKSGLGIQKDNPLNSISALADCTSPGSEFKTLVYSGVEGAVRFEQKAEQWHLAASLNESNEWMKDFVDSTVTKPDTVTRLFLRGHEFHMDILYPEFRFRNLEFGNDTLFSSVEARVLTTKDQLNGSVQFFYRKDNNLPLGMRNTNHTGMGERDIFVYVDQWEETNNISLFRNTYILQGTDTFHYRFVKIEINSLNPSTFDKQIPLIN